MLTFSLGYEGQSCESCARGYYRDYYTRIGNMGSCLPCDCNGNEQVISRKNFKNSHLLLDIIILICRQWTELSYGAEST